MSKTTKKTHEQFVKELNKISPTIKVLGKYKTMSNPVDCECKVCGYNWSPNAGNLLHNKSGCPVCAGNKIVKGINDLWTTNPEIAKMLKNKEDGYITSHACNSRKFEFICPSCSHEMKKRVSEVYYNGLSCPRCSDGYSYPEKLLFEVLKQLNVDFETQKTFDWIPLKYYDFYLTKYNTLVEVHGLNHYKSGFTTLGGKSVEEEQENDLYKKTLALNNGISNYIVIDCRYSKLDWCKNSIMSSDLKNILSFEENDIDWELANINSFKSRKITACNLWNEGKTLVEIANELKVARNTIREYLNECTQANLCNYDANEYKRKNKEYCSKKVICLNNKKIYDSISEVNRQLGLATSSVAKCCKGKQKYCGIDEETNEELHWKYYSEYIEELAISTDS